MPWTATARWFHVIMDSSPIARPQDGRQCPTICRYPYKWFNPCACLSGYTSSFQFGKDGTLVLDDQIAIMLDAVVLTAFLCSLYWIRIRNLIGSQALCHPITNLYIILMSFSCYFPRIVIMLPNKVFTGRIIFCFCGNNKRKANPNQ